MSSRVCLAAATLAWVPMAICLGCNFEDSKPLPKQSAPKSHENGQKTSGPSRQSPPLAKAPFDSQQAKAHQEAWANSLGINVEITNSIGIKMVLVPPGEFQMGSLDDEWKRAADEPLHPVRITRPFYLGVTELTQSQYEQLIGKNPSEFSRGGAMKHVVAAMNTENFPVENVSWNDAIAFCSALSQREGKTYRLPTEAEWEYACRAGTTTPFSFGEVLNGDRANCDGSFPYGTVTKGPFLERPTNVGSYVANAFGLYDMHGNVAEWCSDTYNKDYYAKSPPEDPQETDNVRDTYRVLRGGQWNFDAYASRSAFRAGFYADLGYNHRGFRVVQVIERKE